MEFVRKGGTDVIKLRRARLSDKSSLPLLYFPLLEELNMVKHCFTTREGGVSKGMFSALNLSFTRGDEKQAVEMNFRRLAEALEVEYENFVFGDQTHTANVRKITRADAGNGLLRETAFFDTDGMITDVPGLVLAAFYADCVPLYLVDATHRAIGLCHSGWRGTVGRIGRAAIEAMTREYGTRPEDLVCAVGPSICRDCYEVSRDVAEEFEREWKGRSGDILFPKGNGKYQLDLWKANEIVLTEAGVKREQIAMTDICTCCNSSLLFSHRATQGKRGNLGAFLMIEEENR